MQLRNCIRLAAVALAYDLNDTKQQAKDLSTQIRQSERLIRRFKEQYGVPGVCVAVSLNGRQVWSRGLGYSNVETLQRCNQNTVMRIASISKPITMALVAKLWEEGKLDLDAKIQDYVKEFPTKSVESQEVKITTRQLVSHLGGIRHYKTVRKDEKEKKENDSEQKENPEFYSNQQYDSVNDSLNIFKNDELLHKPGSKFTYTTFGWTLVSAICEGAGGEKFEQQMTRLFRQMGMHKTYLDRNKNIIGERTNYYCRNAKHQLENCPQVNNSSKWAGGGLLSTVGDLLSFAHVLLYSYERRQADGLTGLLKASTVEQLWHRVVDEKRSTGARVVYGMGFGLQPVLKTIGPENLASNESSFVSHSGNGVGASSIMVIKPGKEPICVAILCNMPGLSLRRLAFDIVHEFEKEE